MSEEKEVPDLGVLVDDFEGVQARIDALVRDNSADPGALAVALAAFVQNDLVGLTKDVATATLIGLQDLEDLVDPVKISRTDAAEISELLLAYKAQNSGNPQLVEKIDEGLGALEFDAGEDGDEEEEEEQEELGPDDEEDEDSDDDDEEDEDEEDEDEDSDDDEEEDEE